MNAAAAAQGPKPEEQPPESRAAPGLSAEQSPSVAVQPVGTSAAPRQPTIFEIKVLVAKTYGLSTTDLESPSREAKYIIPRSIAMHLAHRLTVRSLPQIALRFGGRHHTSVLNADRRVLGRRQQEPAFDAELCALERQLTAQ